METATIASEGEGDTKNVADARPPITIEDGCASKPSQYSWATGYISHRFVERGVGSVGEFIKLRQDTKEKKR
jgi:hypothetical protein